MSNNITDYSLLVGVQNGLQNDQPDKTRRGFKSTNGNEVFYFGIIDLLTEYSTKKVLENHVFHIFNSDISCLPPEEYNERFKTFIYKYIFSS